MGISKIYLAVWTLPVLVVVPLSYYTHHYVVPPFPPTSLAKRQFQERKSIPRSFAESRTVTTLINPRGYTQNFMSDSRSVVLSGEEVRGLSDEQILAKFTKGFFGGWVFYGEMVGLEALKRALGDMIAAQYSVETDKMEETLSQSSLEIDGVPPIGTKFASGAFMVVNCMLPDNQVGPNEVIADDEHDYMRKTLIDIAYGNNKKSFAGVHRFEVHRFIDASRTDDRSQTPPHLSEENKDSRRSDSSREEANSIVRTDKEAVRIVFYSFACDPINSERRFPGWMHTFHVIYARWLFWDGIRNVIAH